jgi:glycosyltransferase involved in cell wall biosynthesis
LKVLFDSQIFGLQRAGGISRYFASLAQSMSGLAGVEPRIVAPFHINEHLARLPPHLVSGRRVEWGRATKVLATLASVFPGGWRGRRFAPDILHKTYYHPAPNGTARARTVVTVHDMIHERHPQDFRASRSMSRLKARAVARADHVICVSEQTRRDLLDAHEIAPERVSVVYHGYDDLASLLTDETAAAFRMRVLGVDQPYLLYVGGRSEYKNFAGLIRAYSSSQWLREQFRLVCFGGGVWSEADKALLVQSQVSDRVHHVAGSDTNLAACYRHAELFVYPSLYEGFGIPPLEAMALDCPVACSNTSSLPEVVGQAAMSFDPADPESIREALESVLSSPEKRADLIERGRQRRQLFSWRRCAEQTVQIYKTVLGS